MILIYTQIHIQYTRRLITTFIWKFIHILAQSQNCNINIHTSTHSIQSLTYYNIYLEIYSYTWTESKLCLVIR